MDSKHIDIIKEWVDKNKKYGWKLEHSSIMRKGKFYNNCVDFARLYNCCIESGELCLAFKGYYMVWLIEDCVNFGYDRHNPLFRELQNRFATARQCSPYEG